MSASARGSGAAESIRRAAALVLAGEVIAFPTETVYGLMALPERAPRIYEIKRRPAEKQLVVMAPDLDALERVAALSPRNRAYAERYWPGPLTLVLPAADPAAPSLGVRIPDHPVALELLRAIGRPVVTTSANLSGEPPAMSAGEVRLAGVAMVVDGGRAPGGVASTVLLADRPQPEVAREGAIPGRELLLFDQAWKQNALAEGETSAAVVLALACLPQPLALIEAGGSAALNLRLDGLRYRFGDRRRGDPGSPVEVTARVGGNPPPVPRELPRVAWRRRHTGPGELAAGLPALVAEARRHAPTVAIVHGHLVAERRLAELCHELGVWRIGLEGVPEPAGARALSMNGERVALVEPTAGGIGWLTPVNEEGEPISGEPPRGASVGVYRRGRGGLEWLMLHRCQRGPEYEGDWSWGPPGGSRLPGEPSAWCARRELREETGADVAPTPAGGTGRWDMYVYEAPVGWEPRLSPEHDRYRWLPTAAALEQSRPAAAVAELRLAAEAAGRT